MSSIQKQFHFLRIQLSNQDYVVRVDLSAINNRFHYRKWQKRKLHLRHRLVFELQRVKNIVISNSVVTWVPKMSINYFRQFENCCGIEYTESRRRINYTGLQKTTQQKLEKWKSKVKYLKERIFQFYYSIQHQKATAKFNCQFYNYLVASMKLNLIQSIAPKELRPI